MTTIQYTSDNLPVMPHSAWDAARYLYRGDENRISGLTRQGAYVILADYGMIEHLTPDGSFLKLTLYGEIIMRRAMDAVYANGGRYRLDTVRDNSLEIKE